MQIRISAGTTKAIDNLSWELSDKQGIANKMPQYIFLSVHDGFLLPVNPLLKVLRSVLLHFPEKIIII